MSDGDYLVRMSPALVAQFATRTIEGYRLTWDFGEPDELGFFTPTVTAEYDDRLLDLDDEHDRRALGEVVRKLIEDGLSRTPTQP